MTPREPVQADTNADHSSWVAPRSPGTLSALVHLPGSKSLTNRALAIAALSNEPTRIHGALTSRDTTLMIDGLRALGIGVDHSTASPEDLDVVPGFTTDGKQVTVECGLAGTVFRFLPIVAALREGTTTFTGDQSAAHRPVKPILDVLSKIGARVHYLGDDGYLPFQVTGCPPYVDEYRPLSSTPLVITVDASESSQFVSASLLLGTYLATQAHTPVHIHLAGKVVSRPHIFMTVESLRAQGVRIEKDTLCHPNQPDSTPPQIDLSPPRWTLYPGLPLGGDVWIEPDLSNAGPFMAAAMVCGGTVSIPHWPMPAATTQPGDMFRTYLTQMGATITIDRQQMLTVRGPGIGNIKPLTADLHDAGELTCTLAALAAFANGPSVFSGISHLRGHETDRLSALQRELNRIGVDVVATHDSLTIKPSPIDSRTLLPEATHGADICTYNDHRMAMFGAIIGLGVPHIRVENIQTVDKTMPRFTQMWVHMLASATTDRTRL